MLSEFRVVTCDGRRLRRDGVLNKYSAIVRLRILTLFGLLVFLLVAGAAAAYPMGALAASGGGAGSIPPSEYCGGCKPPLVYSGGAVLSTLGSQGVTVTPIYWTPPGAENPFPGNYEPVINGYIANLAAASATDTNVFSINTEYYNVFGGQPSHIRYRLTAGSPVVDTRPLPRNGCRPATGYHACVTDGQLVAELKAVLTARHLPRGPAHFYPMFFPQGVETDDGTGSTSASSYCAYHSNDGVGAQQIVYGNEPYTPSGCDSGQSPNANPAADSAISILSHELNESTTDPSGGGWLDTTGQNEIGDICNFYFGAPLGSTDPSSPATTEYNQAINGGRYYTQLEFSNYAFGSHGVGSGCQPSESAARGSTPTRPVTHMFFNPSPNALRANGRATSSIFVQVYNKNGVDLPGDRVTFKTYLLSGAPNGECGKLRPAAAVSDGAGTVAVTYRASRSNVACAIVANDAMGGQAASAAIYQGTTRSLAPRGRATFPHAVTHGRTATFTTTFANPMRHPIGDSQVHFWITSADFLGQNVRARQIHLSVSWHGRRGPFVPVAVTGATLTPPAAIIGVIGGGSGFSFRARHTTTLTYRLRLSNNVPRLRRHPLQFEAFLEQINPGSGVEAVLAHTGSTNVAVR